MEVTNQKGEGIKITGLPLLELSALAYTSDELEQADYAYKLPDSNKTVVKINHAQTGVGGDDSWGQETHPEFRLPANKPYHYSFLLSILD